MKQQGARGSLKLKTVTFKAGLLADWEHEAYFGPLMTLEEVKAPFDSLTDFIFSKFYMTTYTETLGMSVIEKGYVEGQEDILADALSTCLSAYNTGTSQRLELVFFSDAIRHAARLSRVLAIQGGHALLLGMSYCTGRVTLARLAAYIAHCKLFEPKPQTDPSKNVAVVREHIKRACHHTGIMGKPTVLLIHEALGSECLQDVCSLMAEGTSPGLYSEDEIQSIVSQMMPGGVQTKRVDKIDQAFERFLKKIRQNLHVIVCLNYKGNSFNSDFRSLYKRLSCYPGLIKYSCSVDVYRQWPYEAYVKMAQQWLQDEKSKIHIPWHPTRMLEQVNMTSNAMAYIHLSAKRVIERQFCHQKEPLRFFSPLTFMEFVHLFRVISAYIVKKERDNIRKHEQALSKVNEAFGSIAEFRREVSDLTPQHQSAVEEIKDLVAQVEDYKIKYIESLDKCKEQEERIEELQGPLEQLRREAQTEFDKVNPNYQAALTALESLSKNDLDEVRSFRTPPELVQFVLNALCLLFSVPQDWESAKHLLIRENFVDDMMFYDKDNIPEDIFEKLKVFIDHPNFQPEQVMRVSKAVTGICVWVHAVYKYADIHRHMQPRLKHLLEHEELFTQAQAKLGQLRVEANRIKSALEKKILAHKAAVKRAKTIEKHMQSIEKRIARAVNLMEHMSMQHFLWKSELKKARHHVLTAPGDALITAACVVYHGPIEDKYRAELMHDWLDRCKQGHFVLDRFMGQEIYPISSNMEALHDGLRDKDTASDVSSSHAGEGSMQSESTTSGMPSLPEIRTFRYTPAIYDTSKYYKSELRKQGSMEYDSVPNAEIIDDSDDEDEQSTLMNRSGFILQDLLSDFDELSKWRLDNLPTDLHSVQNALFMRVSSHNRKHCWPLLIDPDNQAEMWVKALQTSRNVFSENDVRSGSPDLSEMVPLEYGQDKDSVSDQLPPSRGTALTFSDYTTEIPLDDTTSEPHAYTSTTDYSTFKSGRHSGQTWNSDDMRPVTSVTNSWETSYSFRVESSLDPPEFNLWIIESDDPSLSTRLINAIVHGVTVLVTHLERKPLDPLFRGLLLKQFYVDKAGNRIIKIGSNEFQYHPNFCLYLSTSIPLFLKGDGLHQVPLHRMCIINMALSDEAIMNRLLIETMKVERKEFEGQKRSNENDIILHRQRLVKEHDMIREKTLMLDVPLLEDKTMLESLLACQKEVEKNRLILEETRYMGDHLEEKFATYTPMITQTAVLYNMIKRMGVLHPYYYIPFYKFIEIYSGIIKSRDRGKGSLGAAQARAQELADATFYAIFKYISMMMFEQHFTLLQLLVAMERMRMNRKTSIKELSFFVNGFDKQGLDECSLLDHKPSWMGNEEWINCLVLEQLHHPFHGLRRSLIQNSAQWEEYFKHSIALMNPVPGSTLQELSVFQKCILWKICSPQRFSELATSMILYDFGSIRMVPDHYNVREIYSYTDKTTPVMFVLPNDVYDMEATEGSRGYSYISPTHEVRRLAKEVGMEGKVRVMNFGVKGQISEIRHALEDCLQSGYWLLIQNYHLAEEPEQGFFDLLKEIVYSKWVEQERLRQKTQLPDDGASLVTYTKPSQDNDNDLCINNTFRLWITTQSDKGRLLPGVLNQHGIKVTCEKTGNFKSTLQKSYKSVAFLLNEWKVDNVDETLDDKSARIMPLALLHSLLIQQSYYGKNAFTGDNHWSLTDLALSIDAYKKVMWKCNSVEGMKDLISQTYFNHCIDTTDAKVVWSLVSLLAEQAISREKQDVRYKSEDITSLLDKLLMKSDSGMFNLKKAVDSLEEQNTAKTVGLPESADANIIAGYSRIMSKDMVQVIGAPELFLRVTTAYDSTVIAADTVLIPQLITSIQKFPVLPETNKTQVYPLDVFFHFEVEGFRTLIQNIQSDLGLIQRRAKGEIQPANHLDSVIIALNTGKVPEAWLKQTFPSYKNVKQWVNELSTKIQMLTTYVREPTSCSIYILSNFLRPDRFLEAIKHTYARKHFKDVNNIEMEIQMPSGLKPSAPPKDGVFVSGLYLHNALWDSTRSVLMGNTADSSPVQEMPVIWFKPVDISSPSKKEIKYELYKCPVYCSDDPCSHGDKNVVTFLHLPTLQHPVVWHQQRVFMSSAIKC
ncbi:hypothetical protein KUTeg_008422 [Tegillarca granosa]|uniref:Uncharacterized protein n=1 Tax=Tegillarca granosa TaxID=220873 RepID=A0ABQ9FBA3_TEGGR|nr:hypothetical protein KUTeg_008422 [Tegillarca granosa]